MNHAATRDTLLPRLLRSYAAYYDVEPMEAQEPLVATAFFHVHGTKYVLSKKAELWATDNNEYVYFFSVPHLTEEVVDQCIQLAYDRGMEHIHPDKNHMSSYIVALFLCDTYTEEAMKKGQAVPHAKKFSIFTERLDGSPHGHDRGWDGTRGGWESRWPEDSGVFEKSAFPRESEKA